MSREIDIDEIIDADAGKSTEYRLWLTVTLDAVNSYKMYSSKLAESYLFDPDNLFFDFVADGMGYEPAALRHRIKKAAEKGNS
jgi:hypothetical protein